MAEIKNFECFDIGTQTTQRVSIVCGPIIIRQGRIFLVQSSDTLEWKLPGGNHHDNESERETVIRETHEETNLNIELVEEVDPLILRLTRTKEGQIFEYLLYHYAARIIGTFSVQLSEENKDSGFFEPDQLPTNCAPNIAIAIKHFFSTSINTGSI